MITTSIRCFCVCTILLTCLSANAVTSTKKITPKTAPPKPVPTTATYSCPQINGTHSYGQFFTQNGRLWHTYIKAGDQMNINTATDPNYRAEPTRIANNVITCDNGSDPAYAFQALEPNGMDCTPADKNTFLCQRASSQKN